MRITFSKFIKHDCCCLINCYLQDIIRNLVILNISISQKVFLFCSKTRKKIEKGSADLEEKNAYIPNLNVQKPLFCCFPNSVVVDI